MTEQITELAPVDDLLTQIRRAQLEQGEQLKIVKGQLTDLPRISTRVFEGSMNLRHDIGVLHDQMAELPGIRTHLENQERELAEIRAQLATIVAALQADPS